MQADLRATGSVKPDLESSSAIAAWSDAAAECARAVSSQLPDFPAAVSNASIASGCSFAWEGASSIEAHLRRHRAGRGRSGRRWPSGLRAPRWDQHAAMRMTAVCRRAGAGRRHGPVSSRLANPHSVSAAHPRSVLVVGAVRSNAPAPDIVHAIGMTTVLVMEQKKQL